MTHKNGKQKNRRKTWNLRGTQEASEYLSDRVEHSESGHKSDSGWCQPLGTDREIRKGDDRECQPAAGSNNGGVIDQLLNEARERLVRLKEDVDRQENQIELLEAVLKRLDEIVEN
jgi:hypothetical protein